MKKDIKLLLTIPLSLLGALFYRMRGGLKPDLPRPIDQFLSNVLSAVALPLIAIFSTESFEWYIWLGFALQLSLSVAMECSGNGGTMDLGYSPQEPDGTTKETTRTLEKWEFLIYPWLYKKVSRYWYDFWGTSLRGFLTTLPCGIFMGFVGYPLAGTLVALTGLVGGLAYMISWKAGWKTEGGEYMTGGFRNLCLALIWVSLL